MRWDDGHEPPRTIVVIDGRHWRMQMEHAAHVMARFIAALEKLGIKPNEHTGDYLVTAEQAEQFKQVWKEITEEEKS